MNTQQFEGDPRNKKAYAILRKLRMRQAQEVADGIKKVKKGRNKTESQPKRVTAQKVHKKTIQGKRVVPAQSQKSRQPTPHTTKPAREIKRVSRKGSNA